MRIVGVWTVEEALAIGSREGRALRAYLDWLRERAGFVPQLTRRQVDFGTVRQQVRLRTELRRYDESEAPDREARRLRGEAGADDEEEQRGRLYRHRADVDDGEPRAEVEAWEVLRRRLRRAVILGDPGMGKSWLLRHEALLLAGDAERQLEAGHPPRTVLLPVLLPLAGLDLEEGSGDLVAAVAAKLRKDEQLKRRLGELHGLFCEGLEGRLCKHGVLLLDALDEVHPRGRREGVHRAVDRFLGDGSCQARLLVTSRTFSYEQPLALGRSPGEGEVELVPFGPGEVEGFIRGWFREEEAGLAAKVRKALGESREVAGMASIPVLLMLLCASTRAGRDVPLRRVELYGQVMDDLLQGSWREGQNPPGRVADQREVLREVAWQYAVHEKGWQDVFSAGDLLVRLRKARGERGLSVEGDLLTELGERDSVLVRVAPEGGRRVPLMFLHRTFHEYLVAEHLWEVAAEEERVEAIGRHWDDPDWVEVWGLYVQLCEGDGGRLGELFETILDPANHEPELDPILCRSEWACLRLASESGAARRWVGRQLAG